MAPLHGFGNRSLRIVVELTDFSMKSRTERVVTLVSSASCGQMGAQKSGSHPKACHEFVLLRCSEAGFA
jgi:hypothetical protein